MIGLKGCETVWTCGTYEWGASESETPINGRTPPAAYTSWKLGPNLGVAPTFYCSNT